MTNAKEHWNNVYTSREITQVGWYEKKPSQSLYLISQCDLDTHDCIVDVGVGASTLIDCLLEDGFSNIVATDISEKALDELKKRLDGKAQSVKWVVGDVTGSEQFKELRNVSLWHDRALLHFLTDKKDQQTYLRKLKRAVKPGGFVIIGVFSLEGVQKCSGLDVKNYDEQLLNDFLGPDFDLLEHLDYTYVTPSGQERPYVYTLFQRHK